jgi:hypothetical protein
MHPGVRRNLARFVSSIMGTGDALEHLNKT